MSGARGVAANGMADFFAALALVLVLEGLATLILASRLGGLAQAIEALGPERARWIGLVLVAVGTGLYVLIRG